jgi:DNA-binding transcriptional MerR regulator
MELSQEQITELESGVTQARMAELAGISASSLRALEKDGLVPLHSNAGKKLYGRASLDALERVRALKASGKTTEQIKTELAPAQEGEAELLAKLEEARAQLEAAKARLAAVSKDVTERIVTRRNELRLTKDELEAIEALRQQNLRRALQVERKAKSLTAQMQYRQVKPHIVRVDLPAAPKRKRK